MRARKPCRHARSSKHEKLANGLDLDGSQRVGGSRRNPQGLQREVFEMTLLLALRNGDEAGATIMSTVMSTIMIRWVPNRPTALRRREPCQCDRRADRGRCREPYAESTALEACADPTHEPLLGRMASTEQVGASREIADKPVCVRCRYCDLIAFMRLPRAGGCQRRQFRRNRHHGKPSLEALSKPQQHARGEHRVMLDRDEPCTDGWTDGDDAVRPLSALVAKPLQLLANSMDARWATHSRVFMLRMAACVPSLA